MIRLVLLLSVALATGGCYGSIMYDLAHPNRPYDARLDGPPFYTPNGAPPALPRSGFTMCVPSGNIIICY